MVKVWKLMKSLCLLLLALPGAMIASPLSATVVSTFAGGIFSDWKFEYISGAPDLELHEITINLGPTDLRFDTAVGGFGSLASEDLTGFSGVGSYTVSASGATLDGNTILTIGFSNFLPGMSFSFSGDVDHPDPTLLRFQNCSGLPPIARLFCTIANTATAATNAAFLTGAALVGPGQIEGAEITYTFGSSGHYTTQITDTFGDDVIRGRNTLTTTAEVIANPEPGTMAIMGASLLGLALYIRRRLVG